MRRRIEVVITGLTRNQLGSNPPRVRISPSPPKIKPSVRAVFVFIKRDSNIYRGPRKVVRLFGERTNCGANHSKMRKAFCFVSEAYEDAVSAKNKTVRQGGFYFYKARFDNEG